MRCMNRKKRTTPIIRSGSEQDSLFTSGLASPSSNVLALRNYHSANAQNTLIQPRSTISSQVDSLGVATHNSPLSGKTEAAFRPAPPNDEKKIEFGNVAIGALTGGLLGAAIGSIFGGVGALVGGLIGALIGGIVGAFVGGISWKKANYTRHAGNNDSTTVEQPFVPKYSAVEDKQKKEWRLKVDSVEGGVDIDVYTGGSRDPVARPPTTQAEASQAVTVMKGYYNRGNRGAWHTEAASKAHEEYHYKEWKCSAGHYWPKARAALEKKTVSSTRYRSSSAAIAAMRSGPTGADAIMAAFKAIARRYWFTLSDSARSRPYAAGQRELNKAVRHVQNLSSSKGWVVPRGVNRPSDATPCYKAFLPYNP